jgi:hypothetical protein
VHRPHLIIRQQAGGQGWVGVMTPVIRCERHLSA